MVEIDETQLDPLLAAELEKASPAAIAGLAWRTWPGDTPPAVVRVHRVRSVPNGRLVAVDLTVPGLIDVLVDADLIGPALPRHLGEHATTAMRLLE